MARIRTIKPEFWTDEKLTECSLSARLLFIGTWNFADDAGNLDRSAKQIKARVFPIDNIDCEPLIQELIAQGLLIEYAVNDKKYLHIQGFAKHQLINRPSKPSCPEFDSSLVTHETLTEYSLNTHDGREGKGREDKKHMSGKPDVSEKFSPDLFEAFWTNWPATDRRTQKAKCLAKWKRENLNDKAETIQQHVTALKRTEKWRNGFEPAPLTYLNGKQWEDGLPEVERQSAKEANDPVYQSLVEKFGSAKRRPDGRIYAGGRIFNSDGSGGLCL